MKLKSQFLESDYLFNPIHFEGGDQLERQPLVPIFQPYPLVEGAMNNEVIEKLVGDPMLLNMIFEANSEVQALNSNLVSQTTYF